MSHYVRKSEPHLLLALISHHISLHNPSSLHYFPPVLRPTLFSPPFPPQHPALGRQHRRSHVAERPGLRPGPHTMCILLNNLLLSFSFFELIGVICFCLCAVARISVFYLYVKFQPRLFDCIGLFRFHRSNPLLLRFFRNYDPCSRHGRILAEFSCHAHVNICCAVADVEEKRTEE